MTTTAGVPVPNSALATAATDFVRSAYTELLFHHCARVFLFASLRARARGIDHDPELLYVGTMFHDLGLLAAYRSPDRRFEVDGADVARGFLLDHGVPPAEADLVWQGIALHTTPGIPEHMHPLVHLVTAGVELDVLGFGFDEVDADARAAVVATHPRPDFKRRIVAAFADGVSPKPDTAFGNVKADVLAHCMPGYQRTDFVDVINDSAWPE